MESATTRPDAIVFLMAQHEEIRSLFADVNRLGGADRQQAFQCLVRLLAVHETAEEEFVHPQARECEGGDAVVEARLAEEAEAKVALAELERLGVTSPDFPSKFEAFHKAVDADSRQEEQVEFPLLRTEKPEILRNMRNMVEVAESMAPTHPHPHGPDSALGNLIVGPFVAVADRLRDALRDRHAS